jgi:hypothetical protein
MSSTFTTPLRINKLNNPTNNGVIAPSNTGAAAVTQQQFIAPIIAPVAAGAVPTFKAGETTATPLVIPAGSIISNVRFYETVAPSAITGGVVTVAIAVTSPTTGLVTSTNLGTITPTTTGGVLVMSATATAAVAALLANVGPLDATITFTATAITAITGTLAGTFSVEYTARNADGSIQAYGSGYTNN